MPERNYQSKAKVYSVPPDNPDIPYYPQIMVKTVKHARNTTIVLQPNRSASWQQTKMFILVLGVIVGIIALGWALAGAWYVIPFAGLEIGLLGFLMYRVCYKSYQKQVITIASDTITVEQGVHKAETRCRLNALQTHLDVKEAENEFDTAQLTLSDNDHKIPVGHFLNHHDANIAKSSFRRAGVMVCSDKWWKH